MKGNILYYQERVGKYGKPFYIIKFALCTKMPKAEARTFQLKNDPHGLKSMRKWRLTNCHSFAVNVLRGDMSLWGPRPERKFPYRPNHTTGPRIPPSPKSAARDILRYGTTGYAENVNKW
ncbi:MAG: sugar transferase [Sphingobacteriales bacterium]|nr:sugar transferase [Sphingobacteriales bacterium]